MFTEIHTHVHSHSVDRLIAVNWFKCCGCVCVHISHNVFHGLTQLLCVFFFLLSLLHVSAHMAVVYVHLALQTDKRSYWPTVPRHLTRRSVRTWSLAAGHLISSDTVSHTHTHPRTHSRIGAHLQIWTKGQPQACSYTHSNNINHCDR